MRYGQNTKPGISNRNLEFPTWVVVCSNWNSKQVRYGQTQNVEFSIETWKIEEKRSMKNRIMLELEDEHTKLTQLAIEDLMKDLEREKNDALAQVRIETENKLRKEYKTDLAKEMEAQNILHDLALKALERKVLNYDNHKIKHQEMTQQFDQELKLTEIKKLIELHSGLLVHSLSK